MANEIGGFAPVNNALTLDPASLPGQNIATAVPSPLAPAADLSGGLPALFNQDSFSPFLSSPTSSPALSSAPPMDVNAKSGFENSSFKNVGGNGLETTGQLAWATVTTESGADGSGAVASSRMVNGKPVNSSSPTSSSPTSALSGPTNSATPADASKALQSGAAPGGNLEATIKQLLDMVNKILEQIGMKGAGPATPAANATAPAANAPPKGAGEAAPAKNVTAGPTGNTATPVAAQPQQQLAAAAPATLDALIKSIKESIDALIAQLTAQGVAPANAAAPKAAA